MKRLIENVQGMAKQGQAAHEVERTLWQGVLAMGRQLMQVFFDSLGDGDEGPVVVLNDGRTVRRLVAEFWDAQPPPAREDGERVVATADGKGVPIRRPAAEAAIEGHRPRKGPKPNRKKRATLAAVYTIERDRRTP